jgi:hypothetical protein
VKNPKTTSLFDLLSPGREGSLVAWLIFLIISPIAKFTVSLSVEVVLFFSQENLVILIFLMIVLLV